MRRKNENIKSEALADIQRFNKKKMRKRRRISSAALIFFGVLMLCGSIYLMFFYNWKAYQRQDEEEEIAISFIDYLLEHADEIEQEQETIGQDEKKSDDEGMEEDVEYPTAGEDGIIYMTEDSFSDDLYYERDGVTFTPDYAKGYLLCVLEYPSVGIRRGVYSGNWDDIYDDLDMWMVTMARPDMRLGQTHLAIYGHNHISQNLSFNNLKNAAVGDQFFLYAESGVYTYEVADIFSDWRTDTTSKYVDDFSIGSEVCYIITCGRDNFLIGGQSTRYKDYIVEGHLLSQRTLTDYAKEKLSEEERWNND